MDRTSTALLGAELARRREQSQARTFTAWMNYHLAAVEIVVKDLGIDLADGIVLCRLCEVLTGEDIKYNKNPRIRIHKIENCNKALAFAKVHKIKMFNISAEDIVDGNIKLILALLWGIIRKFEIIASSSLESYIWEWESKDGWVAHNLTTNQLLENAFGTKNLSHKLNDNHWTFDLSQMVQFDSEGTYKLRRRKKEEEGEHKNEDDAICKMLIAWLCEITEMHVNNLTSDVQDGRVLSCMVTRMVQIVNRLGVEIGSEDTLQRIQNLINCGHECLQIPALIDAHDLSQGCVDQKSMMLYLSLYKRLYDERKLLNEQVSIFEEFSTIITDEVDLAPYWQDSHTGNIWRLQTDQNFLNLTGPEHLTKKEATGKWTQKDGKWNAVLSWEDNSENAINLVAPNKMEIDNGVTLVPFREFGTLLDQNTIWTDEENNMWSLATAANNFALVEQSTGSGGEGTWVNLDGTWIGALKWDGQTEQTERLQLLDPNTLTVGKKTLTRYEPWFRETDGDWKDQQTGQVWKIESVGSKLKISDSENYHHGVGQWRQLNDKWTCPILFPSAEHPLTLEPLSRDMLRLESATLIRQSPINVGGSWRSIDGQIWAIKADGNSLTINGTGHNQLHGHGQIQSRMVEDTIVWSTLIAWSDGSQTEMTLTDQNNIHHSNQNHFKRMEGPPPLPPPAVTPPLPDRVRPMGGTWDGGVYVVSNRDGLTYQPTKGGDSGRNSQSGRVGFVGKGKDFGSRFVRESKHMYRTTTPLQDHDMGSRFNKSFKFSSPEPLYHEFPCKFASTESAMLIGYAYVTKNFFCFCGANGKDRLSVILALEDIASIKGGKSGLLSNYSRVPSINPCKDGDKGNAIIVRDVHDYAHRFYSVDDCAKALKILKSRWSDAQKSGGISNSIAPVMDKHANVQSKLNEGQRTINVPNYAGGPAQQPTSPVPTAGHAPAGQYTSPVPTAGHVPPAGQYTSPVPTGQQPTSPVPTAGHAPPAGQYTSPVPTPAVPPPAQGTAPVQPSVHLQPPPQNWLSSSDPQKYSNPNSLPPPPTAAFASSDPQRYASTPPIPPQNAGQPPVPVPQPVQYTQPQPPVPVPQPATKPNQHSPPHAPSYNQAQPPVPQHSQHSPPLPAPGTQPHPPVPQPTPTQYNQPQPPVPGQHSPPPQQPHNYQAQPTQLPPPPHMAQQPHSPVPTPQPGAAANPPPVPQHQAGPPPLPGPSYTGPTPALNLPPPQFNQHQQHQAGPPPPVPSRASHGPQTPAYAQPPPVPSRLSHGPVPHAPVPTPGHPQPHTSQAPPPTPAHAQPTQGGRSPRQFYARVLETYKPAQAGDIELQEGTFVLVLDSSDPTGWWTGRNQAGQTGVFPSNFVSEH